MNNHSASDHDINTWLEAMVSGTSTPETVSSGDLERRAIHRSIGRFHGLARRSDRIAAEQSRMPRTWEDLMNAQPAAASGTGTWNQPIETKTRPKRFSALPRQSASPWAMFGNGALVVVLLAVISAGLWRVNGGFGPGGGNDNPDGIPFGGQVAQDSTPETDATSIDPALLPKAEDCTITPLTIDQVIWYVTDPYEAERSLSPDSPTPEIAAVSSPSDVVLTGGRHANAEELAGAADTLRMYFSCQLAQNYFAYWATMDPLAVGRSVLSGVPPLTDEATLRSALEELLANGPSRDPLPDGSKEIRFWAFDSERSQNVEWHMNLALDLTLSNSWTDTRVLIAAYGSYYDDGSPNREPGRIWDNQWGTPIVDPASDQAPVVMSEHSCQAITFAFNEARDTWLIYDQGGCG